MSDTAGTGPERTDLMKLTVKYDSPLLEYLYSALAPQSRTGIKSLLAHSRISVNGKSVKAFDHPLHSGDMIDIGPYRKSGPVHKDLKIVYEDGWLIVADKKAGLPAISTGRENETTAYSILYSYMQSCTPAGRIFIVHRLDRDTSGLIVFAKDAQTKRMLQENWDRCVTERKYFGVCEGRFDREEGKIVSWLTENPKSLKMNSSPYDNGGKKAVTNYRVSEQRGGLSLLEIELETGRKNQIRVQLASVGHPIAGDRKYGAVTNPFGRLALHAATLSFRHPRTGEFLSFTSPQPFRL